MEANHAHRRYGKECQCVDPSAFQYQCHRPEKTFLYQLVSKHYPVFRQQLAEEGRMLPDYVQRGY
jgi:hypothetical protein